MNPQYLSWQDEQNFGREIIDLIQRGSREAMAPVIDARRVINFFRGFLQETGQPAQPAHPAQPGQSILPSSYPAQSRGQFITRPQILQMSSLHRQGKISDADYAKWEAELCRASKEGRILGGEPLGGLGSLMPRG